MLSVDFCSSQTTKLNVFLQTCIRFLKLTWCIKSHTSLDLSFLCFSFHLTCDYFFDNFFCVFCLFHTILPPSWNKYDDLIGIRAMQRFFRKLSNQRSFFKSVFTLLWLFMFRLVPSLPCLQSVTVFWQFLIVRCNSESTRNNNYKVTYFYCGDGSRYLLVRNCSAKTRKRVGSTFRNCGADVVFKTSFVAAEFRRLWEFCKSLGPRTRLTKS